MDFDRDALPTWEQKSPAKVAKSDQIFVFSIKASDKLIGTGRGPMEWDAWAGVKPGLPRLWAPPPKPQVQSPITH